MNKVEFTRKLINEIRDTSTVPINEADVNTDSKLERILGKGFEVDDGIVYYSEYDNVVNGAFEVTGSDTYAMVVTGKHASKTYFSKKNIKGINNLANILKKEMARVYKKIS